MLKVNLKNNSTGFPLKLTVQGHLGAAPSPECAAASALLQYSVLALAKLNKIQSVQQAKGNFRVYFNSERKNPPETEVLINTFYQAVAQLKQQFPGAVKLNGRWKLWQRRDWQKRRLKSK